jgi:hypothetical protein
MRSLRPLVLAALAGIAVVLTACGSSSPTAKTIREPGVGANLRQVQAFFGSQGGGHWQAGSITGGIVGYAVFHGLTAACPVSLSGTVYNITNINLFCRFGGAITSNPQQARSIITATVHRFAPGATDWVGPQLDAALAPNTTAAQNAKKRANGNAVLFTRAPGQNGAVTLIIEPYALSLGPPSGPTTTTTTKP